MTRVNATEARRQLFKLLDAVESGKEVVLERGGVRFRLSLDKRGRAGDTEFATHHRGSRRARRRLDLANG